MKHSSNSERLNIEVHSTTLEGRNEGLKLQKAGAVE